MADPDEALIEAIAEVVHEIGCGCPDRFGIYEVKVACAVVAHLGLVEETRLKCYCGCGAIHNQPTPREAWTPNAEVGAVRLVSRWVEVDHGSE